MSNNKPFNSVLFETFDKAGKEAIRKFLEIEGYLVAFNPNDYEGDLILLEEEDDGLYKKVAIAEVGVRYSWKSEEWPSKWKELRIEARKSKYLKNDLPVWFFVLNSSFSKLMIFDGDISSYPIVKSNNRFQADEDFYNIPIGDCTLIELQI